MTMLALPVKLHVDERFRELYPRRTPAQMAELETAIVAAGRVYTPILVDENGAILDGHHRYEIALKHNLEYRCDVQRGLPDKMKRDLIFSVNHGQRPPLNNAQKREAIAASLKADADLSDLEHSRRVGVNDKTVAKVRAELIANSEIPNYHERSTASGQKAPGPKPKPKGESTPDVERPEVTPGSEEVLQPQRRMRRKSASEVIENFKNAVTGIAFAIDDYGLENLTDTELTGEEAQAIIRDIDKAFAKFRQIKKLLEGIQ